MSLSSVARGGCVVTGRWGFSTRSRLKKALALVRTEGLTWPGMCRLEGWIVTAGGLCRVNGS